MERGYSITLSLTNMYSMVYGITLSPTETTSDLPSTLIFNDSGSRSDIQQAQVQAQTNSLGIEPCTKHLESV